LSPQAAPASIDLFSLSRGFAAWEFEDLGPTRATRSHLVEILHQFAVSCLRSARAAQDSMSLSATQLRLLILISARGSVTVAEAGALLHLSLPTVNPAAAQLVRRGLLGSLKGRPRRLFLTELGAGALDSCFDWMARLEAATTKLTPEEQKLLASVIPRVSRAMMSADTRSSAQAGDAQDPEI
jgi:DNA-binding MarR family transcriptional regulator